jgi:hypothetical protein
MLMPCPPPATRGVEPVRVEGLILPHRSEFPKPEGQVQEVEEGRPGPDDAAGKDPGPGNVRDEELAFTIGPTTDEHVPGIKGLMAEAALVHPPNDPVEPTPGDLACPLPNVVEKLDRVRNLPRDQDLMVTVDGRVAPRPADRNRTWNPPADEMAEVLVLALRAVPGDRPPQRWPDPAPPVEFDDPRLPVRPNLTPDPGARLVLDPLLPTRVEPIHQIRGAGRIPRSPQDFTMRAYLCPEKNRERGGAETSRAPLRRASVATSSVRIVILGG